MALKVKTYNNVQANVTFSKASSRVEINPTAGAAATENIALTLGKISKWYDSLVPTGGSSGKFLGWNSSGTAKWVDAPTAEDKNMSQTLKTDNVNRPLLMSIESTSNTTATVTTTGARNNSMYGNVSTGLIFCRGREISNVTLKTGSTAQSHITLNTLMTWLITSKNYIPSGKYCHVVLTTAWDYSNSDILQVSINSTNYEIQLAGVIIEFMGSATSYNAGTFRLLIHSSPTTSFTAATGYTKFPTATIAEYTCNGSSYSPVWKMMLNAHPTITVSADTTSTTTLSHAGTFTAITSVTRDSNGHTTKVNTATYTLPSDNNTTYTFATGDAVGQFKVKASTASGYTNYNVNGISAGTDSGTANLLAYYSTATKISSTPKIAYHEINSTASTPVQRNILHLFGAGVGNDAPNLISGTVGIISYGDGGPQINFNTASTDTITGGQNGAIIFTDHDSAATGVSWHFVSDQTDWNVISKRFHAKTSISIGTDRPPSTAYTFYVTGSSYYTSDIVIGTSGSSSNDTGDIAWKYGNGNEKARIWFEDTYTAKQGPRFRLYKSDGTSLYSGYLPLADGTSASGTWGISITGTAASANKLNTNAGEASRPVYFSGGIPVKCDTPVSGKWWNGVPYVGNNGVLEIGKYIDFHGTDTSTADYTYRFETTSNGLTATATGSYNVLTMVSPDYSQIRFQTTASGKGYTTAGIVVYPLTTSGMTMLVRSDGNTVVGGGESASTLYINSYDNIDTAENETLYLASDSNEIHLITNVQAYSGRKVLKISDGQLVKSGGLWIAARDNAPVYANKSNAQDGGYYPAWFAKSKSGGWSMGVLSAQDNLYITYTTDADYSADPQQNQNTYQIQFQNKSGTVALTSDIPTIPTVNNASLTLKGAGTTVTTFTANASTNQSLDIVAGTNVTITPDATNHKITIASTDTKVTQTAVGSTYTNYRPLVISASNAASAPPTATTVTDGTFITSSIYCQPSSGSVYATKFIGPLQGNADTATKWKTARTLTIGSTGKSVDGSGNVSWSLSEIGAASSSHTHNYAASSSVGGPALSLHTDIIDDTANSHATVLQTYFNANKSTIPRDKVLGYYSRRSSNGSIYMGYFLHEYDSNPYGGFFVAHYNTPYYVGISNGTYTEQEILTSTNYTTYTVKKDGTGASGSWGISVTGTSANVTGTVAIDHGGTGATTRLNALKNLTNENVGTSATYFLTITNSWGKGGYTSVADVKTVLGLGSAAYTSSTDYVPMETVTTDLSANTYFTKTAWVNWNKNAGTSTTNLPTTNWGILLTKALPSVQVWIPDNASGIYFRRKADANTDPTAWWGFTGTAGNTYNLSNMSNTGLGFKTLSSRAEIDATAGSFIFGTGALASGSNADWIGFQADSGYEKFQLVAYGGSLLYRDDDAGGTSSTWEAPFRALQSLENVTGSGGITVTHTSTTIGTGSDKITFNLGAVVKHTNSITAGTAKGDNSKTLTFGGTFTIPSITYDANGHITTWTTTTMTMPSNPNTNTTYTLGTSGNNVTLTPSSGSVQSITVPYATNAGNVYGTVTNGTTTTTRYGVVFAADPNTSENNTMRKTYDFRINLTNGSTSTTGMAELVLGNEKAKNTADNKQGSLTLYSPGTSYHEIFATETNSAITHTFPATSGTILNSGTTSFTRTLSSGTKIGSIKINGTSTDIYAPTNTDANVTQTATTTNANYEVLFSATDDNTTRTETARKNSNLKFNPSTGMLNAGRLTLTSSTWGGLTINRTAANAHAGIVFQQNGTDLGSISMGEADSPLIRWKGNTAYKVYDEGNVQPMLWRYTPEDDPSTATNAGLYPSYTMAYMQNSSDFGGTANRRGTSGTAYWAHYLTFTHTNNFRYLLRLPFWGVPQYQHTANGINQRWYSFVTEEEFSAYKALQERYYSVSSAGWYRLLTFNCEGGGTTGNLIRDVTITVRRQYNNASPEAFAVRIIFNYDYETIQLLYAKQNIKCFTKIRTSRSSDKTKVYVELYYDFSSKNDFSVRYDNIKCWDVSESAYMPQDSMPANGTLSPISDSPTVKNVVDIPTDVLQSNLKLNGSYWGMCGPDGNDEAYIRTSSNGLIPYEAGGITNPHSYIGTSSYYFSAGYIKYISAGVIDTHKDDLTREITYGYDTIDFKYNSTGGWATGVQWKANNAVLTSIGGYGSGTTLNYMWIGGSNYESPALKIHSNLNIEVTANHNILLRTHANGTYKAGIGYDTQGNECVAFWAKNAVTRFRFHSGVDMETISAGSMMGITPDFEIYHTAVTSTVPFVLWNSSGGNTPALIFRRKTDGDDYVDWRVVNSSANLYFDYQYNSASWTSRLWLEYNGGIGINGPLKLKTSTYTTTISQGTTTANRTIVLPDKSGGIPVANILYEDDTGAHSYKVADAKNYKYFIITVHHGSFENQTGTIVPTTLSTTTHCYFTISFVDPTSAGNIRVGSADITIAPDSSSNSITFTASASSHHLAIAGNTSTLTNITTSSPTSMVIRKIVGFM